jgi:uncharacterized repeat protein (TIGR01451 family)
MSVKQNTRTTVSRWLGIAIAVVCGPLVLALPVAPADATGGPALHVEVTANTTVAPGGTLGYFVTVSNRGTAPTTEPIVLTLTLPAGVTSINERGQSTLEFSDAYSCSGVAGGMIVTCTTEANFGPAQSTSNEFLVHVPAGAAGGLTATVGVTGGGSRSAQREVVTQATETLPGFGVESFDGSADSDAEGDAFTQAGGHPADISTSIDFNTVENPNPLIGPLWPVEQAKDVVVELPAGVVGDPQAVTQCTEDQLANAVTALDVRPLCPASSQVGTTTVVLSDRDSARKVIGPLPVFNLVPPPGVPARFGFNVLGTVVTLDAHVRSGSDYGITISATNISEGLALASTSLTFWGVPADSSHDGLRACPGEHAPSEGGATCAAGVDPSAFLRLPSSCEAPSGSSVTNGLVTTLHTDSWVHPGDFNADGTPDLSDPAWHGSSFVSHLPPGSPSPGPDQLPTGCAKVPFTPSFSAQPAAPAVAGAPGAFVFDLGMPQSEDPESIGEADLRRAVVTLPVGVRLSPSAATGLGACSPEQIGLHTEGEPDCPEASKLGEVTIETPLLKESLTGSVYLATPHENPFGTLAAVYLVAQGSGVTIKLPGRVDLDPVTGQITTTFDDTPQLPFSNLQLKFHGGSRAPLALPNSCGTYLTHATLTSWSGRTVELESPFTINTGCAAESFSPGFMGGTTDPVAGGFSPLSLRFQRADSEQRLASLSTLHLPPGLLADVASVPVRCTEAQAAAAACPAASRVGSVEVGSGPGTNPVYVPGDVYLMGQYANGPFKGDPFGLAVIVHAVAGPFDLGYVVVRNGIQVNSDGSITAQSEPFPQILQGIPLDLRDIQISLDRPGFAFNPTNCNPLSITGTLDSSQGLTAPIRSAFGVGECHALKFAPSFTASTQSNGLPRAHGASLKVHLAFPHTGPQNTGTVAEANAASVKVSLPKALPARLATLQKACTAAQFQADPAGCPQAAFVGQAIAHTPILASPLAGPAILVSHGGQAFPDLDLVLQGEGITIILTGNTKIKNGITTSTFASVPDAPVSTFDLTLPEGEHSVLAAIGKLCRQNLQMPTAFVAQNGATHDQSTHINVEGCPHTLAVISHTATRHTLKLAIYTPAAGKLTATGTATTKASKTSNGSETIHLTLHTTKPHPPTTTIKLTFQPAKTQTHRSTKPARQTKTLKIGFPK